MLHLQKLTFNLAVSWPPPSYTLSESEQKVKTIGCVCRCDLMCGCTAIASLRSAISESRVYSVWVTLQNGRTAPVHALCALLHLICLPHFTRPNTLIRVMPSVYLVSTLGTLRRTLSSTDCTWLAEIELILCWHPCISSYCRFILLPALSWQSGQGCFPATLPKYVVSQMETATTPHLW